MVLIRNSTQLNPNRTTKRANKRVLWTVRNEKGCSFSRLVVTCHRQTFISLCLLFEMCTLCAVRSKHSVYAQFTINLESIDATLPFGHWTRKSIFCWYVCSVPCTQCALVYRLNRTTCGKIAIYRKKNLIRQCEWERRKKSHTHTNRTMWNEREVTSWYDYLLCIWICINWFVIKYF